MSWEIEVDSDMCPYLEGEKKCTHRNNQPFECDEEGCPIKV